MSGKYDKYGRKLKKSKQVVDDLKAFYAVDEDENEEELEQAAKKSGQ